MSGTCKPTEHGGLKEDGTPDKRVGTGQFAQGQVDPHKVGKQGGHASGGGGSAGGETYKPTEHGGKKQDGTEDGHVLTAQMLPDPFPQSASVAHVDNASQNAFWPQNPVPFESSQETAQKHDPKRLAKIFCSAGTFKLLKIETESHEFALCPLALPRSAVKRIGFDRGLVLFTPRLISIPRLDGKNKRNGTPVSHSKFFGEHHAGSKKADL
ncbi:hypothetical protein G7Y89_g7649 [Cudoniella acicularis]|uniref:Uncharacterized protein n=1 Tax=Cudoniella acicularis TaxID=354080 RepID=A0A8H4RKD8_9HELO|nr:hypothetical protein G7Y89_g7649 [Cudoniella acicularis]